jgi:Malectin domain
MLVFGSLPGLVLPALVFHLPGMLTFARGMVIALCLATAGNTAPLLRIAAGGPGGADSLGNVWSPDAFFSGGATWTNCGSATTPACPGAVAPPYFNLRYQTSFYYTLQVSPGFYNLTLAFLEPNKTGPGQRLFNVTINGQGALNSFDIFQASGGQLHPITRAFPVVSTSGAIQVVFTGIVGNAVVSGLQLDTEPPFYTGGSGITIDPLNRTVSLDTTIALTQAMAQTLSPLVATGTLAGSACGANCYEAPMMPPVDWFVDANGKPLVMLFCPAQSWTGGPVTVNAGNGAKRVFVNGSDPSASTFKATSCYLLRYNPALTVDGTVNVGAYELLSLPSGLPSALLSFKCSTPPTCVGIFALQLTQGGTTQTWAALPAWPEFLAASQGWAQTSIPLQ